jgi:hypothetical protein
MYHLLYAFAHWLENTGWALNISGSTWAYPYVQLIHFTGLSLWVGTCVLVDLHLLGIGSKRLTSAELNKALFAWNWTGLAIAVTGGFMLFATAATSFMINPAFELKLGLLVPLGIILHIVVQQTTKTWGQTKDTPAKAKILGGLELLWWFAVATTAASIPYFEHIG